MLEIVEITAGLDVSCLCRKWGGRGRCGGVGSVNQSLGGFGCSLPVFVALEENWM